MKHLGASFFFYLTSVQLFCQCGGYLDNKFKADSCFRANSFEKASVYYLNCLNYSENMRRDYYYLFYSLVKINKSESAFMYLKEAASLGLHYFSLEDFKADSILQKFSHDKEWIPTIKKIELSTIKYTNNSYIDTNLVMELSERVINDQKYRGIKLDSLFTQTQDSLWIIQKLLDIDNQQWLKNHILNYGWPNISKAGVEGDNAAWLIVQHADNDTTFQRYCLNILKQEIKSGGTNLKNIAYLEDRLLINGNKMQIYGTQFEVVKIGDKTVDLKLKPTVNIECLNKRRAYMNLQSVEDYLSFAKKRYIRN